VTEVTSRTTKVLVSKIVAVRTFSSVSWRTGVLLPWRRAPVKNSRCGLRQPEKLGCRQLTVWQMAQPSDCAINCVNCVTVHCIHLFVVRHQCVQKKEIADLCCQWWVQCFWQRILHRVCMRGWTSVVPEQHTLCVSSVPPAPTILAGLMASVACSCSISQHQQITSISTKQFHFS